MEMEQVSLMLQDQVDHEIKMISQSLSCFSFHVISRLKLFHVRSELKML